MKEKEREKLERNYWLPTEIMKIVKKDEGVIINYLKLSFDLENLLPYLNHCSSSLLKL